MWRHATASVLGGTRLPDLGVVYVEGRRMRAGAGLSCAGGCERPREAVGPGRR